MQLTVYSGAWVEGLEITYELFSGVRVTATHGTTSGIHSMTNLDRERAHSTGIALYRLTFVQLMSTSKLSVSATAGRFHFAMRFAFTCQSTMTWEK